MTEPEVQDDDASLEQDDDDASLEQDDDDASLEQDDDASLEQDDETRPDRATGKSDPWHGLDDFED